MRRPTTLLSAAIYGTPSLNVFDGIIINGYVKDHVVAFPQTIYMESNFGGLFLGFIFYIGLQLFLWLMAIISCTVVIGTIAGFFTGGLISRKLIEMRDNEIKKQNKE